MPLEIVVHESQYPEAVHRSLVGALSEGRVPGRFLYDSPGQAARWLAYHQAWSPSRTADEIGAMYEAAFDATWARLDGRAPTYVGVGCGGGQKDARFLRRGPAGARYVAVDTSPALVMQASLTAADACVDMRRVVLDLTATPDRDALLGKAEPRPTVWSCFGLVPNLDVDWLLPWIRKLLHAQDCLLISFNLSPTPYPSAKARIVPQYDNSEARAWYRGALEELGLSEADAQLVMRHRPLREDGAAWRIEAVAEVRREAAVRVFDETFPLAEGAELEVFHSDRFLPEHVPELFAEAGLDLEASWISEDREEGVYLLGSAV